MQVLYPGRRSRHLACHIAACHSTGAAPFLHAAAAAEYLGFGDASASRSSCTGGANWERIESRHAFFLLREFQRAGHFDVVVFEHRESMNFRLGFCFSLDDVGNECPHRYTQVLCLVCLRPKWMHSRSSMCPLSKILGAMH